MLVFPFQGQLLVFGRMPNIGREGIITKFPVDTVWLSHVCVHVYVIWAYSWRIVEAETWFCRFQTLYYLQYFGDMWLGTLLFFPRNRPSPAVWSFSQGIDYWHFVTPQKQMVRPFSIFRSQSMLSANSTVNPTEAVQQLRARSLHAKSKKYMER